MESSYGIQDFIVFVFGSAFGFGSLFVFVIGDIYWLWIAIQIGSFWMFLVGFTPLFVITGPIGAYSLLFGVPNWVFNLFG